jgi:hypothetical protein
MKNLQSGAKLANLAVSLCYEGVKIGQGSLQMKKQFY